MKVSVLKKFKILNKRFTFIFISPKVFLVFLEYQAVLATSAASW